jgi:hypothetical protein
MRQTVPHKRQVVLAGLALASSAAAATGAIATVPGRAACIARMGNTNTGELFGSFLADEISGLGDCGLGADRHD